MCGCGCFGRLIALLLMLVFVIQLSATVWSQTINRSALRADSDLNDLLDEDFYDNVLPLVLPALSNNNPQPTPPPLDTLDPNAPVIPATEEPPAPVNNIGGRLAFSALVENLDQDDWASISREIIPGDYLEAQTQGNLTNLLSYLRGESARLHIEFETGILRDNLLGQPGDRMVNRIFSSFEPCDAAGEARLIEFLNEESDSFPYCKPDDPNLQREVFTTLNNTKDELASEIPETWILRDQMAEQQAITLREVDVQLYEAVQRPSVLSQELYWLNYLLAAATLAIIVIFAVDSSPSFFRWTGWSMMFAGTAILLPLLVVPVLLSADFTDINQDDPDLLLGLETLRGFLLALVGRVTMPILGQGALTVAIGFICLFFSILLPNPDEDLVNAPWQGSTASVPRDVAVSQLSQRIQEKVESKSINIKLSDILQRQIEPLEETKTPIPTEGSTSHDGDKTG